MAAMATAAAAATEVALRADREEVFADMVAWVAAALAAARAVPEATRAVPEALEQAS